MEELIQAGIALRESMGHKNWCPKVTGGQPCQCGCAGKQVTAVARWDEAFETYSKQVKN